MTLAGWLLEHWQSNVRVRNEPWEGQSQIPLAPGPSSLHPSSSTNFNRGGGTAQAVGTLGVTALRITPFT